MKIIVAPDSYKGSLTAEQAAEAMKRGITRAFGSDTDCQIDLIPMSDGGEGFTQSIVTAQKGTIVSVETVDPLGRPITADYGLIDDGRTAIIETAAASGITFVENEKRPHYASTYGTGLLIRDALDRGCDSILIGLGGSATNDGGIGMAQALGFQFTNHHGRPLDIFTNGLEPIGKIESSDVHRRLHDVTFTAACDVKTVLYGENGATAVFGPQKGVKPLQISTFDHVLRSLADAVSHELNVDVHELKGGGAAGGLGAGLAAFCGAQLKSGVELVLEVSRFKQRLKGASLVITGEGQTDRQTAMGKVPAGIGKAAKEAGVPVFCISGSLGDGWEDVKKSGVTALFSIMPKPAMLDEAMNHAESWLADTVSEVISTWNCLHK